MRRNPPHTAGSPITLALVILGLGMISPLGLADSKSRDQARDAGSVDPFAVVDAAGEKPKKAKAQAKGKTNTNTKNKNKTKAKQEQAVVKVPFPLPGGATEVKVDVAESSGAVDPFAHLEGDASKATPKRKRNANRKKKDAAQSPAIAGGAVDPFAYLEENAPEEAPKPPRSGKKKKNAAATTPPIAGGAVDPFAHLEASAQEGKAQRDRDPETEPDPFRKASSKPAQKKKAAPAAKGDGAVDPFDALGR